MTEEPQPKHPEPARAEEPEMTMPANQGTSGIGVWRSLFGWKALFRWDVLGAIVPGIFIACGFALLGLDWFPHNLLITQILFGFGSALCVVKFIGHAVEGAGSVAGRTVFAVVLSALAISLTISLDLAIQGHKHPAELRHADQRVLTDYQRTRLRTIFARPEYHGQIVVVLVSGGDESWSYGEEVATLFDGWRVLGPFHANENELAMDVQVSSSDLLPPPSQIPQMVLSSFQLVQIKGRSNLIRDPDVSSNVTVVWVGPKSPDGTTPDNRTPESTHLQAILAENSVTLPGPGQGPPPRPLRQKPSIPPTTAVVPVDPTVGPSVATGSDPDIQLLKRAVDSTQSCLRFQRRAGDDLNKAKERIRWHDTLTTDPQMRTGFDQWAIQGVDRETEKLYEDSYKSNLKEVRNLLVPKVPEAAEADTDYDEPRNIMGIMAICRELTDLTAAYVDQECLDRKITGSEEWGYLNSIRGTVVPKCPSARAILDGSATGTVPQQ